MIGCYLNVNNFDEFVAGTVRKHAALGLFSRNDAWCIGNTYLKRRRMAILSILFVFKCFVIV